jgi:Ca2+/Na+ antiporter
MIGRRALSSARSHTLARRRRSLAILGVCSLVTCLLAVIIGGPLIVIGVIAFVVCFGGYLNFLRAQARRERDRRDHRRSSGSTR